MAELNNQPAPTSNTATGSASSPNVNQLNRNFLTNAKSSPKIGAKVEAFTLATGGLATNVGLASTQTLANLTLPPVNAALKASVSLPVLTTAVVVSKIASLLTANLIKPSIGPATQAILSSAATLTYPKAPKTF